MALVALIFIVTFLVLNEPILSINVKPNHKFNQLVQFKVANSFNKCECFKLCSVVPQCEVVSFEEDSTTNEFSCKFTKEHVELSNLIPSVNSHVVYCDNNFELFGKRFYAKSPEWTYHLWSKTHCTNLKAQLVTMETPEYRQEVLQYLARTDLTAVWLGISKNINFDLCWEFANGTKTIIEDMENLKYGIYFHFQLQANNGWMIEKSDIFKQRSTLCVKY